MALRFNPATFFVFTGFNLLEDILLNLPVNRALTLISLHCLTSFLYPL